MIDALKLAACTGATAANAARFAPHLADGMTRFGIASPRAISVFLGQVGIESEGKAGPLASVEEDLYYTTADRLRAVYPSLFVKGGYRAEQYLRNPSALSQLRYQGFHGRGLIQLTWRDAYVAAGKALGYDYVERPPLVCEPFHAALTACWFFAEYKACLPAAEVGDVYTVTGRINGAARLKLAERRALTDRAYRVLTRSL